MPTTFANTIDSNPIYAKRAEEDQNGLNIDQNYAKKSELPTVNDGTLTIQKNGTTVDTFTANSSSNKTVNIEVPTKTSDLTNDSGFITANDIPAQVQSNWNETDNTDPSYIQNKPSIPAAQVNSDWNASSGVSEILNKPSIPTATSDLTNDSGFITASDVPASQEQADWNESDSSDPAYIKNKPTIPAAQVNSDWNASSGVAEILNKPSIPSATSDITNDSGFITASDVPGAQEQADWNESDSNDPAYIKNKPSIPAAQVNSDWNASSGVAQILNKPTIPSATSDLQNDSGFITASDVPGAQEQADWNETNSSDPAYIKNKPTIPAAPVQSNWNESDSSSLAYIQNKPSIPAAQVNSDWNASSGVAEILNKPTIPSATSDLTNDSGFITSSNTINIEYVNLLNLSTRFDGTTARAILNEMATGKRFIFYEGEYSSQQWQPDSKSWQVFDNLVTSSGAQYIRCKRIIGNRFFEINSLTGRGGDFDLNETLIIGKSVFAANELGYRILYTLADSKFTPGTWVDGKNPLNTDENEPLNYYVSTGHHPLNEIIAVREYYGQTSIVHHSVLATHSVLLYKCILEYSESSSTIIPADDPTHWKKICLTDLNLGQIQKFTVTPSTVGTRSNMIILDESYNNGVIFSTGDIENIRFKADINGYPTEIDSVVIQWTVSSITTLPTIWVYNTSEYHQWTGLAASANPTYLTVGKTYQLSILNNCYSIVEFG